MIEVRLPDEPVQRIERSETDPGEWTLRIGDEPAAPRWPLLATRVRSILQLIDQLRAAAATDADASVGDRAITVVLHADDDSTHTLRMSERTLGGTGLLEYQSAAKDGPAAPPRRAMVEDRFIATFRNPGPRGWRTTAALPGVGPEISRLRIENDQAVIALARTSGRWHLVEPVAAPANANKVAQVISALQKLTITDFQDTRRPDPALTRLDAPTARIRIETDVRTAAPDPAAAPQLSTRIQEIAVGGPADSTGKNLFAALGTDSDRRIVAIDATGLAAVLVTDPAAYMSPNAVATVAADVGSIALAPISESAGQGRTFKRSMGSWAELLPDGREAQLATGDADAVGDVLTFLSSRPAAAIHTTPPEGYTPAGTVSFLSLGGAPLEQVEVGVLPTGTTAIRSGQTYRVYSAEATPQLIREWLAASGARPPAPPSFPIDDILK